MDKRAYSVGLARLNAFTLAFLLCTSCSRDSHNGVRFVSKDSVEAAHGLKLPQSALNLQQKRIRGLIDHGVLSLCEIDQKEVQQFIAQLRITARNLPTVSAVGNPCLNGWNVWPTNSATFVPGNKELEGLKPTWKGEAKPIEMLSCGSTTGDWLHVEIWSVGEHAVIKLYTDWN